ncbi:major facilitator superfamily domain-containing protein 4A-like [Pollicipes pollicipes]|uniref:major facilitator superfamily domain-containing protein 4A-like n=1 Tax=Pollicipes pollicipes TaxID=41117 RepID=UPI0018849775|nr:major facilitator superfamily domain-containing protein 4A-like [Pollicipes pollicipes]
MRLLGDKKKKQYEANLRQGSVTGGLSQKEKKADPERNFRPVQPAPVSPPAEKRVQFWSMFLQNWHVTITYCFVFWSFGMCVAFLGPTLDDLGCRTETPLRTMSWVFFAQALFTLIGSIIGGVLVQRIMDGRSMLPCLSCLPGCASAERDWRVSAHGAMLVSLLMLAVTLSLVPQCWSLPVLALDLAAMGLFMGVIDTISNLCMIQLYGANVSPFLQALHFFYALGAFASPMIIEPFLLSDPHRCFDLIEDIMESRGNSTDNESALLKVMQKSEIQYGFWIMALLQLPVAVLVVTVLLRKQKATSAETYEIDERGGLTVHHTASETPGERAAASPRQVLLVTLCTIVLCFMYDGLQGAYGGYIYNYATKTVEGLSITQAAYLTSCFWGTFAIGRLLSIGIATKLAPAFMILFNIVGCGLAAVLMLIWQNDKLMIYVGTSLFGLSLSSIYPTAISLAETYINVSSVITSLIVVGAAAGEMVQPVIVGHEFDGIGPAMFLINILLVVLISIIVVFALFLIGASIKKQTGIFGVFSCCVSGADPTEDTNLMSQHVTYYSRMPHEVSSSELHFTPTAKGS